MKQSELYTIARFGDKETAFTSLCDSFYREQTGYGETLNPHEVENLTGYVPPIERKKNETVGDYHVRQLDYFLKHTKIVKVPFWKRIKIVDRERLIWVK